MIYDPKPAFQELNNDFLNKEAKRIIQLLKKDFVFPDGSFFLEKDGDRIFPHHIYPDLGDFINFFLYFGEKEFVNKQIDLFKKSLVDGLMISEHKSFGVPGLVKSYDYTDLLLGLYDLYLDNPTEDNKKYLINTTDRCIKIFKFDKDVKSYYYPPLNLNLPLFDTRDGTFIEFFCDMYEVTKDEKYLDVASNIYRRLINTNFYKKYDLLPTFDAPEYIKKALSVIGTNSKFNLGAIIKNNTNSLFGLLAIAKYKDKKALDEIWKIIDAIMKEVEKTDGAVPLVFDPKGSSIHSSLSATFPVIDFLCDLYDYNHDERAINIAKKLADFWITKQGKTGLFPYQSDNKESFFDAETDMTISFYKLWEKTLDEKYKYAADFCTQGLLKYHGEKDYILALDIDNGAAINNTQRTKFIALFLKLIILRIEYNKGLKIYSSKSLIDLLRDR